MRTEDEIRAMIEYQNRMAELDYMYGEYDLEMRHRQNASWLLWVLGE